MKRLLYIAALFLTVATGCKSFLDVVPDNVPTINNAFTMRQEAIKYLGTCYSYMPSSSEPGGNPALLAGDEYWQIRPYVASEEPWQIAMGFISPSTVYMYEWEHYYRALRDCNIFLENVGKVVDLADYERIRWVGEVKFLKAYYHWQLFLRYGPIPLVEKNLPIDGNHAEYKVYRAPVDSVINYISNLMMEAAATLPYEIADRSTEMGRVTAAAALSIRAKVLVTAASPLFNGNPDHAGAGKGERSIFATTYDPKKWERAVAACDTAIKACARGRHLLYQFSELGISLSPAMTTQMSLRNAMCEDWNREIILGNSQSRTYSLQTATMPRLDPNRLANESVSGALAPTMKMAEMFYSEHGVPIQEDIAWDYPNRFKLRKAVAAENEFIYEGYTTVGLHYNREPRFYASLGFDGGIWLMKNATYHIENKAGQWQSRKNIYDNNVTGYYAKKVISWKNEIQPEHRISVESYSWPEMRLADLYLLYAEALNEVNGPNPTSIEYVDYIRTRAGIPGVVEAWTNWSRVPNKFTTKEGLRQIIQQERLNELAFEGHRFWDLRRWKRSIDELNKPIMGWDMVQEKPEFYYRPRLLYRQSFQMRDYLWPLHENDLLVNENLVQNPGW
ncbi:RagB/SusD family nutrient uptake outer membrane protein [Chitinophaga sp.]|uniref:RagB/SusD family nutrient uptake outer membrane protein n=1 Tax=Chitinophaga sp. TaxID=1869181 RepID=UPI002619F75F|nr:RagB/SusD family nutrient uptake outer membrane protein [uncultured Chitinophaga sp.]